MLIFVGVPEGTTEKINGTRNKADESFGQALDATTETASSLWSAARCYFTRDTFRGFHFSI